MRFLSVLCLISALSIFTACDNHKEELAKLRKENSSLKEELANNSSVSSTTSGVSQEAVIDSLTYDAVRSMIEEIEMNLEEIQTEEKKIKELKEEHPESYSEDELVNRVVSIHSLAEANKEKFYYLNKQLKNKDGSVKMSESKVSELQVEVDGLDSKIQSSEAKAATLTKEVQHLTQDIEMLEGAIEEVYDSGQEFFEESDRAYIAIGTQDYFLGNGLIINEGGFMGVGSVDIVNPDFDQSLFDEIEKSLTEEIIMDTEILFLASSHPNGSYEIAKENGQFALRVTDGNNFWRQSRHIILITAE